METIPQWSLELARVTGNQAQVYTWLLRVEENDLNSIVDSIELDALQLVRFPARFFGDVKKPSWRIVKYHCQLAYLSECFFRCISEEQWLRTVITRDLKGGITIHSNSVPRQAYLRWLEGMKATCPTDQCIRGFLSASFIRELGAWETFPGLCCSNCALVEQLQNQMGAAEFVKFWYLEETDVRDVNDRSEARGGSEGEVCKSIWRQGTFARKRFNCQVLYQNKSFFHELDVALKVSHPNIAHYFGWSDKSFEYSLFMEWLEEDLERFLHESAMDESKSRPFSFRETLVVLLQVAEAMRHVHEQNFVHGDLKPGNILMGRLAMPHSEDQFHLMKVADFGCAQRVVSSNGATVEPFYPNIGTQYYIAPEVLRCRGRFNGAPPEHPQKIDVYSFGVVAYQVLTGVQACDFPDEEYSLENVMKPDGDETQWRPNGDFNFHIVEEDRLSLVPFIKRCWAASSQDRPTFPVICHTLRDLHNRFYSF